MNLNSLDPYLNLFDNISWSSINSYNANDIYFADTDEPITADPMRFQELQRPLTTGPIRISFPDEDNNEVVIEYPPGMSILHILGAISTYYRRPISQEFFSQIQQNPNNFRFYPEALEKVQRGEFPNIGDFMGDHHYFEGFTKDDKGNYAVSFGS